MKLKKIIYVFVMAIMIFAIGTGCKKSTFDINKNPNQPTDSTIAYNVILPAAQNNTGRIIATQWGWLQNWLGYWARSGTYAPNTSEESYEVTTNFGSGIWNALYDNNYDYQTMQYQATRAGADYYAGIARIMKAHNYAILVDLFNNVPYTEALKGSANITPKYDKGIDIYKDLLRQIDTGMALIQSATESTSGPNKNILADDIIFGTSQYPGTTVPASKIMWSKFASTLRLRLLMHLTSGGVLVPNATVAGIDVAGEFTNKVNVTDFKIVLRVKDTVKVNNYGFLAAGEDVKVNPGYSTATTAKMNPFYSTYVANNAGTATGNSQYYRANSYALEYYEWDGDPREAKIYDLSKSRGVAYGLPSATENAASELAAVSGAGITDKTKAQTIFSATEGMFLQAEARHRGFITGSADVMVQNGILESFNLLNVANASTAFSTYLSYNTGSPDVYYTGGAGGTGLPPGGIFTILSQKWFALNAIAPYEVYTDYRRVNMKTKAGTAIDHFIYGEGSFGFYPSAASGYPPNTVGPAISVSPANTATTIPSRLLYPQNEYNYNSANVGAEGTVSKYGKVFWDN